MRNPQNDTLDSPVPERTCILTRRKGTKDEFIRLALSPDGEVAPDARARAPGRGAWIGVARAELDAANAKGKLKGALQRAFKTSDVTVKYKVKEDGGKYTIVSASFDFDYTKHVADGKKVCLMLVCVKPTVSITITGGVVEAKK